jgi:hypothetical protein
MSVMIMSVIEKLEGIRSSGGKPTTRGLPDETIERFAKSHPELAEAIEDAAVNFQALRS